MYVCRFDNNSTEYLCETRFKEKSLHYYGGQAVMDIRNADFVKQRVVVIER